MDPAGNDPRIGLTPIRLAYALNLFRREIILEKFLHHPGALIGQLDAPMVAAVWDAGLVNRSVDADESLALEGVEGVFVVSLREMASSFVAGDDMGGDSGRLGSVCGVVHGAFLPIPAAQSKNKS